MVDPVQARLSHLCELAVSELANVQSKTLSSSSVSSAKTMFIQCLQRTLISESRCSRGTRLLPDLPRRVLHRIFEFLDVHDCISVSETCSTLRDICLAHPPLWNTINIPRRTLLDVIIGRWPDNNFERTRALLKLSRPDPVLVSCSLDYPDATRDAFIELLTESTMRAVVLYLDAYREAIIDIQGQRHCARDPPSLEDWTAFASALCQPAPFLRTFLLCRKESSSIDYLRVNPFHPAIDIPLNPYIFGGIPGALRVCYLRGINLPMGGCAALAMLRTLDYQPLGKRLRSSHLIDILQQMPHLEVLGLSIVQFVDDTHWSNFEHRSLSRIAIETNENFLVVSDQCMPFFSHLGARTLHISTLDHDSIDWNKLVDLFGHPEHLRVAWDGLHQTFEIASNTRQLRLSPYPSHDLAHFSEVLFTRLASLTLHEELWDLEHVPPPAPKLVRLHIVCSYNRDTPVNDGTFGVFAGIPDAPWRCPLLTDLTFSFSTKVSWSPGIGAATVRKARDDLRAITVSLGDILLFVKTAIAFDAFRLRSIRLHGVSALADPDRAAVVISLQDVVEDIQLSPLCSSESQELFDICDTFSQPPARYFDPSVPHNDWQQLSYP